MLPKYKILITGGSGFIGTNLIESFALDNHEILNLDIHEPEKIEFQKYWKNININDFQKLKQSVSDFEPDYILHLAARTDLDGKTLKDYETNILGVENLLKVANCQNTLKKLLSPLQC